MITFVQLQLNKRLILNAYTKKLGDEPRTFKTYLTYCKDMIKASVIEQELSDYLKKIKHFLEIAKHPYEELTDELKSIAQSYLHITYDEDENIRINI